MQAYPLHRRVLHGTLVRLERSAGKVACCVLRGLGEGDLAWLPGAEQGQEEEGIAQIRQGLATHRATGAELSRPFYLALLTEAHGKVGQAEEGLSVLVEALAHVHKTGERFYEAELYRLKGQLTLQKFQVSGSGFQVPESAESEVRSPESEAEECFWEAIEIARRQQAKSLELRAVMSLSRL
jgi:predicted ATPase